MKNQYFGDICDYLKYGLLRSFIQQTGQRLAVCWMLTEDDGRTDGGKTGYLGRPENWNHYDHDLFDILQGAVKGGRRHIGVAAERVILPGAAYHADVLADNREARRDYFEKLRVVTVSSDLVFFDPDNGFEVRSTPAGRKNSSKYLYWDDVRRVYAEGKSLIVFQHFNRMERSLFMAILRRRLMDETGAAWVGILRTSNVAYFVVPAAKSLGVMQEACETVTSHWSPHIINY